MKTLNLPVIMDNDANVGILGEALYGAGAGYDSIFYMTLSTGIEGGIILDGKIYRGEDCLSGEIGHVMIQPDGLSCRCGSKGCIERDCGGFWMEKDFGITAKELLCDRNFVRKYVINLAWHTGTS